MKNSPWQDDKPYSVILPYYVILSEAKDLTSRADILRFTQDDTFSR